MQNAISVSTHSYYICITCLGSRTSRDESTEDLLPLLGSRSQTSRSFLKEDCILLLGGHSSQFAKLLAAESSGSTGASCNPYCNRLTGAELEACSECRRME